MQPSVNQGDINYQKPFIVSVGRFDHQKGFDLLIQAFINISKEFKEWNLVILGDGIQREYLQNLIKNGQIDDKVYLPGFVKNPFEIMQQADIFAFPSRFEGFGNTLIEAMSLGLPVIASDCEFGPSEIINDEIDGILIEKDNIEALRSGIKRLIIDEKLRGQLGGKAKDVIDRFSLERVMGKWENLIQDICMLY